MTDMTGIAARIAASSAIQAQADKVLQQAQTPPGGDRTKIEKAARDFESVLLGHWLEEAQKSFSTVPGADSDQDDDDQGNGDPGHDQFQGLAMQALAGSLANSGGIGIARMIARQLDRQVVDGKIASPDQEDSRKTRNKNFGTQP